MKEFKKEIKIVKIKTDRSNLKCPFCGSQHVYIHSYKNILLKNHVFDDKIQYLDVKFKRFICSIVFYNYFIYVIHIIIYCCVFIRITTFLF